jgi:magnesium transporter
MEGEENLEQIDNPMRLRVLTSVRHRLPWLVLGLAGGLLAAQIITSFEQTLSQNILLASFIPLVVYISDAVGTQMESFVIRDIAIHKGGIHFFKYFSKQFVIVTIIGLILAAGLWAITFALHQNSNLSLAITLSMFFAIESSIFTGIILPVLFRRLRLDPANASGPIATIVQDVLSVTIYFLVASKLLG